MATIYVIGKCHIKKEHRIPVALGISVMDGEVPEDDSRVRHSYMKGKVSEYFDEHGAVILRLKPCFFVYKGVIVERDALDNANDLWSKQIISTDCKL
jgi:hypothetical protein